MSGAFAYHAELKKRLRRIEGQLGGVLRMMDTGSDCKAVITQLSAVRSATDKAIAQIVAENLQHCLLQAEGDAVAQAEQVKQAIELLTKSR
jgi:DNA-binding FrmR family transcriptional regulator